MTALNFECVSINGFAGDRSPEAMLECHRFTEAFANYLGVPFELVGEPQEPQNLSWEVALVEAKATFKNAVTNLNRIFNAGHLPILVTPRCATAIASLPAVVAKHSEVVVLYFDAHGDLNVPETSESGYLGGMPITAALGEWHSGYGAGLKASNLVHLGGRDIDVAELRFIDNNDILTLSKSQIETDLSGLRKVIKDKPVFIHLDTDVYDPTEVTAEYAVDDGLFRHHISKVLNAVLQEGQLIGLEITELSPKNDQQRQQSYAALFESFAHLK